VFFYSHLNLPIFQELRFYSKSIKQEILKVQDKYTVEFSQLGKSVQTYASYK